MAMSIISAVRILFGKTKSALTLRPDVLGLVLVAWVLLWLARAAILIIPGRHLAMFYGEDQGTSAFIPLAPRDALARAKRIRQALALAVKYSPASANCYPQALVARLLLGMARVPFALFFGVSREGDTGVIKAHAWVMSGPIAVSGGNSFRHYSVARCFTNRDAAN